MNKNYLIILIIILLSIFVGGLIYYRIYKLQQNSRYFDLSSKCMKDAKNFFNEKYPGIEIGYQVRSEPSFIDYQNHYDSVSNKCYILITTHFGQVSMGDTYIESTELYDVEDRVLLGKLIKRGEERIIKYCKILGKECYSLDDFKLYIPNLIDEGPSI